MHLCRILLSRSYTSHVHTKQGTSSPYARKLNSSVTELVRDTLRLLAGGPSFAVIFSKNLAIVLLRWMCFDIPCSGSTCPLVLLKDIFELCMTRTSIEEVGVVNQFAMHSIHSKCIRSIANALRIRPTDAGLPCFVTSLSVLRQELGKRSNGSTKLRPVTRCYSVVLLRPAGVAQILRGTLRTQNIPEDLQG